MLQYVYVLFIFLTYALSLTLSLLPSFYFTSLISLHIFKFAVTFTELFSFFIFLSFFQSPLSVFLLVSFFFLINIVFDSQTFSFYLSQMERCPSNIQDQKQQLKCHPVLSTSWQIQHHAKRKIAPINFSATIWSFVKSNLCALLVKETSAIAIWLISTLEKRYFMRRVTITFTGMPGIQMAGLEPGLISLKLAHFYNI